jgi:hypothetical protein
MAPQASMFPHKQENAAIMEAVFSVLSLPRCYEQGKLEQLENQSVRQ